MANAQEHLIPTQDLTVHKVDPCPGGHDTIIDSA